MCAEYMLVLCDLCFYFLVVLPTDFLSGSWQVSRHPMTLNLLVKAEGLQIDLAFTSYLKRAPVRTFKSVMCRDVQRVQRVRMGIWLAALRSLRGN